jgi:quinolinate synthase
MNSAPESPISFDYPQQNAAGATCIAQAWAKAPRHLAPNEKLAVVNRIKQLLKEKDAALVAHYYVDGDIQDLAMARS